MINLQTMETGFVFDLPPTLSCHAATVCRVPDGYLVCWFGGTEEGNPDVSIYLARYNGSHWTEPLKISREDGVAHWNPVLYAEGMNVFLWYKVGPTIPEWKTFVRISRDGGKSFSEPREAVPGDMQGGRGPVKNKPIRLSDGSLLAPASREYADGRWIPFTDLSSDGGLTWEKSAPILPEEEGIGLIQPSSWEDETGVHMFLRSNRGWIYRADSSDLGRTWSKAKRMPLPNNNSGMDLVPAGKNNLFLACNPVSGNWGRRAPLSLLLSSDGGKSFTHGVYLEEEYAELSPEAPLPAGESRHSHEYSYPSIIYAGNEIFVVYTWKREKIAFARFQVETE